MANKKLTARRDRNPKRRYALKRFQSRTDEQLYRRNRVSKLMVAGLTSNEIAGVVYAEDVQRYTEQPHGPMPKRWAYTTIANDMRQCREQWQSDIEENSAHVYSEQAARMELLWTQAARNVAIEHRPADITAAAHILEMRAKLFGIDAPQRFEVESIFSGEFSDDQLSAADNFLDSFGDKPPEDDAGDGDAGSERTGGSEGGAYGGDVQSADTLAFAEREDPGLDVEGERPSDSDDAAATRKK